MPNVQVISLFESIKPTSWCSSRLDHFLLRPSGVLMTGIGQPKDTWSSRPQRCRQWRSSLGRAFLWLRNPERSHVKLRLASRCCHVLDSSTEWRLTKNRCRQLKPNLDRLIETCMTADRAIMPLHHVKCGYIFRLGR